MTLSSSQLRLISAIGIGVLVGTSLIVIIPEGIEAVYSAGSIEHSRTRRSLGLRSNDLDVRWNMAGTHTVAQRSLGHIVQIRDGEDEDGYDRELPSADDAKSGATSTVPLVAQPTQAPEEDEHPSEKEGQHKDPPTFYIGLSLILGFILMFLIDKLPRHASENLQPPPPTRHISLDNLSQGLHSSSLPVDEDSESFLQSLTPSPKQTRSLATTTGLVIHAFADGIAMGASASSSNTSLGFIIFLAIMVHKAPAAFGLTSVLLKQGLSKRAARGHLIIFSLASPSGALSTWLLVSIVGGDHMEGERGQWWTGMLLLFSAGTFL
jgi:zinc transporter 9